MVLAAGFGTRLRPLTETTPKPLVSVCGETLLDRALDRLGQFGIERCVVNAHYLKEQIADHLVARRKTHPEPELCLSEEEELLDSGGGVVAARALLGEDPFFVINGDSLWLDGPTPALTRLAAAWDPERMDALLMVMATRWTVGYEGPGDFFVDPLGAVTRRGEEKVAPYAFIGLQILNPVLLDGQKAEPFSLNRLYDKAIEAERAFAVVHDGAWYHISTPEDLATAEQFFQDGWVGPRLPWV